MATWAYAAAVAACLGLIALRWVAGWWACRGRRRLQEEPRCGRCDYIIRAGSSVVCPECGGDVREVGVVTPRAWRAAGVSRAGVWYLLAALLALPMAYHLTGWVAPRQPFGWRYGVIRWCYLDERTTGGEANPSFRRFYVEAHGGGRYFARAPAYVLVHVEPRAASGRRESLGFSVRAPEMTILWWDRGAGPTRVEPFRYEAVESFVGRAAPEAPPEERRRVAREIERHTLALARGDFSTSDVSTWDVLPRESVGYALRDGTWLLVGFACYFLVLAAMVWVMRRSFTRLRRSQRAGRRETAAALGLVEPGSSVAGNAGGP